MFDSLIPASWNVTSPFQCGLKSADCSLNVLHSVTLPQGVMQGISESAFSLANFLGPILGSYVAEEGVVWCAVSFRGKGSQIRTCWEELVETKTNYLWHLGRIWVWLLLFLHVLSRFSTCWSYQGWAPGSTCCAFAVWPKPGHSLWKLIRQRRSSQSHQKASETDVFFCRKLAVFPQIHILKTFGQHPYTVSIIIILKLYI